MIPGNKLADCYFANSFADADDVVTFGDVDSIFAVRLFQFYFFDADTYYAVYFQLAADWSIFNNDLVVVGADFDGVGFCYLYLFYGMRSSDRLLCIDSERVTSIGADQQDYGK